MFELNWTGAARDNYTELQAAAEKAHATREAKGKTKSSKQEGLLKQINKALRLLKQNPRHPGLQTHEFRSLQHPHDTNEKVFEAYVQSNTPCAYRVFWCYGPGKGEITVIDITQHP